MTKVIRQALKLAACAGLLLWFSAQAQPQLSASVQERIADIMAMPEEEVVKNYGRKAPEAALPFIEAEPQNLISVEYDLPMPERKAPMPARAFFTEKGEFLALESINKIEDPRRMATHYVEQGTRNTGNRIVARKALSDRERLDELWAAVARRVPMDQIREFNVSYVEYEFENGERRPVFIVNIWGPENPLDMPEELPEVLKNRIRLIYDVQEEVLYADNLL